MPDDRLPKQLLFCKIDGGKRPAHGVKKRWVDMADSDVKQLGIRRDWYRQSQDRAKWRKIVKDGPMKLNQIAEQKESMRKDMARRRRLLPGVHSRVCNKCGKTCKTKRGLDIHQASLKCKILSGTDLSGSTD